MRTLWLGLVVLVLVAPAAWAGKKGALAKPSASAADIPALASLLERADGRVKLAVVMHRFGCDANEAGERLERAGGYLGTALGNDGAR